MPTIKIETATITNSRANGKIAEHIPSIKDFSDDPQHIYTEQEKALIETGQAVLELIIKQKHEQIQDSRV